MKKLMIFCLTAAMAVLSLLLCGCEKTSDTDYEIDGLTHTGQLELQYAEEFSVDYYEGGYKLISISDGTRFLTVPEGESAPGNLPSDINVIYQPLDNIYLAATSAMCLFDALDSLDSIRFSGTKEDGWYIENARTWMAEGKILFAGKYSEPDYELLLSENCPIAIESMMIGHASKVKDKLEELGIAVLTDCSSLESHPLGRTEWIKLYAALLNLEDKADEIFTEQAEYLHEVESLEPTGKTVAFFYVSSSGKIVARRSGDYVTNMIELAGGEYIFSDLGDPDSKTSTVTIEMETFYDTAKDADYIIYNSTIGGEIGSVDELIAKNSLLADFKAVQEGNVWCTENNMYQQTTELGQIIRSFHAVFSGEADEMDSLPYLYRLK